MFYELFQRGGPIMWPLLACSILVVTITIERMIFWWRENLRHDREAIAAILRNTERGDFSSIGHPDDRRVDAAMRMLSAGLAHREYGMTESLQSAAGDELKRMKAGLAILDTIITAAPLLGILGSISGIIDSFDLLGASEIRDPRAVTSGIAEALISTIAGLAVALMALLPFNYFIARIDTAANALEKIGTQCEMAYKRGIDRAGSTGEGKKNG